MLGECAEFGARCIHFCMGAAARGTLSRPAAGRRSYATWLRASGRRPCVLRLAARARSSPCLGNALSLAHAAFAFAWAQRPEARCHGLRRDAAATPQGSRISEFAMNPNFGTRTGLATSIFVSHEDTKARRHEGTKGFEIFQLWYSLLFFVASCLRVRFFLKLRESDLLAPLSNMRSNTEF